MISIVIPTYKRNEQLAECLSLLTPDMQGLAASLYEVIVTDDSPDGEARRLVQERFPWVRWVKGPGNGPAANRNNGVRHAVGEWLIFTDDDCLPATNWIKAYLQAVAAEEDTLVYEGKTVADRPQVRYDEESPINETGGHLWSCNFAIKKTLFERLSGFDEGFPYAAMEDVDFHYRVAKVAECRFLPAAVIVHPWRRISADIWLTKQYHSRIHFYRKHRAELGFRYRYNMAKSFLATMAKGGLDLFRFSFRGWKAYMTHCAMRFSLIFAY